MPTIDSTAAAFVAGAVTSVHCMVMCGPLACAWALGSVQSRSFGRDTLLYHGTRLLAYTAVGAIGGAVGSMPTPGFLHQSAVVLPWILALVFLVVALGMDRWIPKPGFLTKPVARVRLLAMKVPPSARAMALGACTPLLPCGPLYVMFALAISQGAALAGAQLVFAFGLGTLPLLWLAQSRMKFIGVRLNPDTLRRIQRGVAFAAVIVIAWRLRGTFTGEGTVACH
jgi:sulfite exporter TauE/SafE